MSKASAGPWGEGRRAWERLNAWRRRGGTATGPEPGGRALDALSDIGAIRRLLDQAELQAVRAARRAGVSWSEIAIRLGITRQSAWERWRDVDDDVPTTPTATATARPPVAAISEAASELAEAAARRLRRRSTVAVPRVIGQTVEAAQRTLAGKGLAAASAEPQDHPLALAGWPNGIVTGQAPEHGARVPPGSVVRLWVERDQGGNAGVREPRRPRPSPRSGREVLPEPADEAVG